MSAARLQQIANATLAQYLQYTAGDRRADETIGRKHGSAAEPRPTDKECLHFEKLLSEARAALASYDRARDNLVATLRQKSGELSRDADENYRTRKDNVLQDRANALSELSKTEGPDSAKTRSAAETAISSKSRAGQLEADLGRPLRTSLKWLYPFVLLFIVVAEIPINRLAFELFFQEAPLFSLLISVGVGLSFAFFAHQAGLWARQASNYRTIAAKVAHFAGVLVILLFAIVLVYLIAAMRQQYLALLDAEASSSFGALLQEGLSSGLSGAREILSVELGRPGWTLLVLNLALLTVGAIVSFVRHDPHPDYEAVVARADKAARRLNRLQSEYERKEAAMSRDFDERIATLDRQLVRIDSELASTNQAIAEAEDHRPGMARAVANVLAQKYAAYRLGNRLGRTDGQTPACLDNFTESDIARALQRSFEDAPKTTLDSTDNVVGMRSTS